MVTAIKQTDSPTGLGHTRMLLMFLQTEEPLTVCSRRKKEIILTCSIVTLWSPRVLNELGWGRSAELVVINCAQSLTCRTQCYYDGVEGIP